MKKIVALIAIIFMSCNDTKKIDSATLLKDLPESFFTTATEYTIQDNSKLTTYKCPYKRFPNTEFSKFHLKNNPEKYAPYFNITLNVSAANKITLDGVELYQNELITALNDFVAFAAEGRTTLVHLNFDENTDLHYFINFTNFIKPIQSELIQINDWVFIYNIESLPDCDCSL